MVPKDLEKIMKKISLSDFSKHCRKVVNMVGKTRQPVVFTKNGHPVAKLVPARRPVNDIFGCLAGTIEIVGK
jgi:prevent-host-death family protein